MLPIYLDYNATTPVDKEVAEAMKPFIGDIFGNPSSVHEFGIAAKTAVMHARKQVADLIGCQPDEIVFTSGGTESNNFAIKGAAFANRHRGNHIIISSVEHPAVEEVCKYLAENDLKITRLPVDEYGRVHPEDAENAINPETILISVMHANNEVGTVQPIEEIGEIAKRHKVLLHSDAAQSLGKIPVDVNKLGVDMLSIAGHKLYAPKGIGALYIRRGTVIQKLIHGADHEMNQRAGTENVIQIVGLGKACEIAGRDLIRNSRHMKLMRDKLSEALLKSAPSARINGHPDLRLPNTLSISFPMTEANTILSELKEVAASAGAACHTDSIEISSVLKAMRVPEEYAMGTLRFSTGKFTTAEEIDKAAGYFTEVLKKLSAPGTHMASPVNEPVDVRLTQFTHGLGCACKIRPQYLEIILKDLPVPTHPDVLVSLDTSDDAAVYRITENLAVVQTIDFFTPIVDDPYDFGAIAAANALSDIYAMGGTPLFALNIVGFPDKRLSAEVLKLILKGASDKASEAGIPIIGGHTVEDTEPKFGMAVTGTINPDNILRNSNAQPGDILILTKPIGTGIIATGMKRGIVPISVQMESIRQMGTLNDKAAAVIKRFPVSACTDVTGFGLMGHLKEMTVSSRADAELFAGNVPVIGGTSELVTENIVPGGTLNNLDFVKDVAEWDPAIPKNEKIILCDAQTSGGLLISVPVRYSEELLGDLINNGMTYARIIGKVLRKGNGKIFVKSAK